MFRVFLDACELVPAFRTDLVLRLGEKGLFFPLWSQEVLEETARAISSVRPDLPAEKINRRIDFMNTAFPTSTVDGWESLIEDFNDLPDRGDRHVVAAATAGRADVILTQNTKDFPQDVLGRVGLFSQRIDEFMLDLWDLKPSFATIIFTTITEMADERDLDWRNVAAALTKADLHGFVRELHEWHFDRCLP